MENAIVYVDHSSVLPNKSEDVKRAIAELVSFVDAHERQLLSYAFYLDEEAREMTLVAVHPDSESLELHMRVAGDAFRPFESLIHLRGIEVYGEPSDAVVEQLRNKARMLGGNDNVTVQRLEAGFGRLRRVPSNGAPPTPAGVVVARS